MASVSPPTGKGRHSRKCDRMLAQRNTRIAFCILRLTVSLRSRISSLDKALLRKCLNVLRVGGSTEVSRDYEDRQDLPNRASKCLIRLPRRPPRPAARDDKDDHPRLISSDAVTLRDSIRAPGPITRHPILINRASEDPEVSNCRRRDRRERALRRGITRSGKRTTPTESS